MSRMSGDAQLSAPRATDPRHTPSGPRPPEQATAILPGRCRLDVVDVYRQPDRAAHDQVVAVPMRVKRLPLPLRTLIETMSHTTQALQALGVGDVTVDRADVIQERR